MNAIEFVEIVGAIKACGQKIKFLSKDFIQCRPTLDRKTGRSFVVSYSLEANKWKRDQQQQGTQEQQNDF